MSGSGEKENVTIRSQFDRSIEMDFQGAKITSDTGVLLVRVIDERCGKWLTEGRRVTHAQKVGKMGLFITMTTVLPSSGLLNDPPGSLQVAGAL